VYHTLALSPRICTTFMARSHCWNRWYRPTRDIQTFRPSHPIYKQGSKYSNLATPCGRLLLKPFTFHALNKMTLVSRQ